MEFLSEEWWDEFGLLGTAFRTCGWLPLFAVHPCWYALLIFKSCHFILSLFFSRLDCWLGESGLSGLVLSHCGVGQKETWPKVVSFLKNLENFCAFFLGSWSINFLEAKREIIKDLPQNKRKQQTGKAAGLNDFKQTLDPQRTHNPDAT